MIILYVALPLSCVTKMKALIIPVGLFKLYFKAYNTFGKIVA